MSPPYDDPLAGYSPDWRTKIRPEVSSLPPERVPDFQAWLQRNQIQDLDHPDSHYDYRGAFLAGVDRGPDGHWPDTWKQHGHPTFSNESEYSQGDGGTWQGEQFIPPDDPLTGYTPDWRSKAATSAAMFGGEPHDPADPALLQGVTETAGAGVNETPFQNALAWVRQGGTDIGRVGKQLAANIPEVAVMSARDIAGSGAALAAEPYQSPFDVAAMPPEDPTVGIRAGEQVRQAFDPALEQINELAGSPQGFLEHAARMVGPLPFLGAYKGLAARGARTAAEAEAMGTMARIHEAPLVGDEVAAHRFNDLVDQPRSANTEAVTGFQDELARLQAERAAQEAATAARLNAPRTPNTQAVVDFQGELARARRVPPEAPVVPPEPAVVPPEPQTVSPLELGDAYEPLTPEMADFTPPKESPTGAPAWLPDPLAHVPARGPTELRNPKFSKLDTEGLLARRHEIIDRLDAMNQQAFKGTTPWARHDDDVGAGRSGTSINASAGRAMGRQKDDGRILEELDQELRARGIPEEEISAALDRHYEAKAAAAEPAKIEPGEGIPDWMVGQRRKTYGPNLFDQEPAQADLLGPRAGDLEDSNVGKRPEGYQSALEKLIAQEEAAARQGAISPDEMAVRPELQGEQPATPTENAAGQVDLFRGKAPARQSRGNPIDVRNAGAQAYNDALADYHHAFRRTSHPIEHIRVLERLGAGESIDDAFRAEGLVKPPGIEAKITRLLQLEQGVQKADEAAGILPYGDQGKLLEAGPFSKAYAQVEAARGKQAFGSEAAANKVAASVARESGDFATGGPPAGLPTSEARLAQVRQPKRSWVDIRGQRIGDAAELHKILHPFRDPKAEAFHVILLDDQRRVVSHTLESSGALNYVQMGDDLAYRVASRAKRLGATRVLVAHNHPSGNPNPSRPDLDMTRKLGDQLAAQGIELEGQYVIDHTEGTFVQRPQVGGVTDVRIGRSHLPKQGDWTDIHAGGGTRIRSPEDVHRLVSGSRLHPDNFQVLYLDSFGQAVALEPHGEQAIGNMEKWLPQRLTAHGAAGAILVAEGAGWRNLTSFVGRNDRLMDMIYDVVDFKAERPVYGPVNSARAARLPFGERTKQARRLFEEGAEPGRQPGDAASLRAGGGNQRVAEAAPDYRRGEKPLDLTPPEREINPDEYLNIAKFALDETGEARLRAEITKVVEEQGIHPKQVIGWDETRALANQLGLGDLPKDQINVRLNGPQMLAIRNIVSTNIEALDGLYQKLKTPLDALDAKKVDRSIGYLERENDALLGRFTRNRTYAGRDLNNLKILANRVMDPFTWIAKAANLAESGGKKLSIEQRDRIRELVSSGDKQELVTFIAGLRPVSRVDQAVTLWKTGLLTNPKTHLANILGNTAMLGLETAKDAPAALVDRLLGTMTGVRSKDFAPIETGAAMWKGAKAGAKEAWAIMKHGVPADLTRWELPQEVTFKNPVLRAYTQIVRRGLAAPDRFFRTVALHKAVAEMQRVTKRALTEEEALEAVASSEYAVFQGGGKIPGVQSRLAQAGAGLRKPLGPVGHAIAPFTQTPGNVVSATLDYSPFGALRGGRDIYRLIKATKAHATEAEVRALQRAASESIGRTVTGTGAAFLGGYILARNGLMTGARPNDSAAQEQWDLAGKQENAVKLGKHWLSLNRLSPIGNLMALGANYYLISQNPEAGPVGAAAGALGSIGTTASEQSFLRGVQDISKAIRDPVGESGKYLKNMVASVIPAIVGAAARGIDPKIRDTRGGFFDALKSRIPGVSQSLPAQPNALGQDKERSGGILGQLFDPTTAREYKLDDPVIRELEATGANLSELNPGRTRPAEVRKLEAALRNTRAPHTRALLERRLDQAKAGEGRDEFLIRSKGEGQVLNRVLQMVLRDRNYQKLPTEARKEVLEAVITKFRRDMGQRRRGSP